MNIAILDSELSSINELKFCLSNWSLKHKIPVNITCYKTGKSLLESNFKAQNIIFLEVKLPDISGIEVAKKLRNSNYEKAIIFLTSYNEYVFEGYYVQALNYLLKPITLANLDDSLNIFLHKEKSLNYIFKTNSMIKKIPYSSIIAFSTEGHYVNIITTKGNYLQKIAFKNLQDKLPIFFIQCHRTLIVNLNHVTKIYKSEIYLANQTSYPISRTYIKKVKDSFINYGSSALDN